MTTFEALAANCALSSPLPTLFIDHKARGIFHDICYKKLKHCCIGISPDDFITKILCVAMTTAEFYLLLDK